MEAIVQIVRIKKMVENAEGKSTLYNTEREGKVWRDIYNNISFKVINPKFLLRYVRNMISNSTLWDISKKLMDLKSYLKSFLRKNSWRSWSSQTQIPNEKSLIKSLRQFTLKSCLMIL